MDNPNIKGHQYHPYFCKLIFWPWFYFSHCGIHALSGYTGHHLNGIHQYLLNTLRPRQNRCHFTANVFKCNFLNEIVWIPIKISLKFVPKGPINNNPALVQIMAWHQTGNNKPLPEPMMLSSLTHICLTRPQWVNHYHINQFVTLAFATPTTENYLNSSPLVLHICVSELGQNWFRQCHSNNRKLFELISPSAAYMCQWIGSELVPTMPLQQQKTIWTHLP